MFRGYKLKFEFNAAHSNVEGTAENAHFHTFTIVLYLHDLNEQMDYFFDIEKNINEWLAPYQDRYLHETELFQGKSTTLESIGDTFYDLWYDKLNELQFDLVRLDIFENPIRMYSVSNRILDSDINELGALPPAFYAAIEFERPEAAREDKPGSGKAEKISKAKDEEAEKKESAESDSPAEESSYRPFAWGRRSVIEAVAGAVTVGVLSLLIMFVLHGWGNYPSGSDTYCHLYRADLILQSLKEGTWFPLYDPYWYNGVEIMRYWGPIPLYVLAASEAVAGTMLNGYILYIGLLFVIGAIGWIVFGRRVSRVPMGLFVGCLWFFLPENMKVIFYDGNMPRALINAILPWMICFIYDLIAEKGARNIIKTTLLFAGITLCHIGTTLMLVAVLLIYLLLYGKVNRNYKTIGYVVLCVLNGMLLAGIWMIPSFHGSGAGGSNNQVMEGFFQNALLSLNPFPAWNGQTLFYFGLALFVLCVLGLFLGNRQTLPGFAVGLLIFFLTSESAYDILSKLPISSYLWMMRFVSMALSFVMAAFLLWKGLKPRFLIFLCILLVIDCIPVVRYLHSGVANTMTAEEKNLRRGEELLFQQAKEITSQRMTVFDLSGYGAFAPYYAAGTEPKVLYMFGAGWEGARTSENIVMLNTAVETGNYEYVFDRCMEMGTDTLLFVIDRLQNKEADIEALTESGALFGYEVVSRTEENLLMHKETPKCFGVISEYSSLAIGNAAKDIALVFPSFEEGKSEHLDDYTLEELSAYESIYLSDFTYDSRQKAEQLLSALAEGGTRIYIDMNKVPVDRESNVQEIFDVSVQSITYHNSFPVIRYGEKEYKTSGFPESNREWKANYLIGLKDVTGKSDINGRELAFSGTNGNDNIVFLGYNFIYYMILTNDRAAEELVSEVLETKTDEFPHRELVPMEVTYERDRILIQSPKDHVGTALADISDVFEAERAYETRNHMITVEKGMTEIRMHYPYLVQGTIVSLIGLLMTIATMIYVHKKRKE